jgi:hypothetical protein
MKLFFFMALAVTLSACSGNPYNAEHRAATMNWPSDPAIRLVAEEWVRKADDTREFPYPPGLDFAFREIDEDRVADHFIQRFSGLNAIQLQQIIKENGVENFYDDEKTRICNDPAARFLLNNGFTYEFKLKILARGKTADLKKVFSKGFCVAGEVPFVDQAAIDDRYNMKRYWPNGDRINIRALEEVMGLFQLIAARFDETDVPEELFKITNVSADGLMLVFELDHDGEKKIWLSKYWKQNVKGRSLEHICTDPGRLLALTVGGLYAYLVKITTNNQLQERAEFTVSYPDCLRYNEK